jgi:hypothetical protein
VAPIKIGVPETILKLFRKYLNNIAGEHEIRQLQNSHIGYCTLSSESADVKAQKIYSLETWLVSGI